jgi:hypothetical protein
MISARANPKVDQYMAALDHPLKPAIERLRALVLAADPSLTEQVKWNAPSYGYARDDRITFRLNPPPAMQLVFHRGPKAKGDDGFTFEDPSGLIQWAAPDRGVVSFGGEADVAAHGDALADLVRRWMKATARGGGALVPAPPAG